MKTGLPVQIRTATIADLVAINQIYNYYVEHSTCTYDEQNNTEAQRRAWFDTHDTRQPIIVAESDKQVIGWGSLSYFRPRIAYRFTVENSVYVDYKQQRRGIGSLLLSDLIERAKILKYHSIIAGIDAEQQASVAFHAKFGFKQVADLRQVGFKFSRWLDVIYMQLML
ncbi:MAG TPA: GNAT family N-acetyltransferase [Phycisphaerae bacterium]|nr:GNAT family N-acetyltransferase [Phycisphaerae bacterium]